MAELNALAAAARRGTARAGLPEPGVSPLGAALARVTRDTPEATLLARAALAGLHAEAGHPPARPTAPAPRFTPDQPPVPSAPEAFAALIPLLAELPVVAREALIQLQASGLHLNALQALPLLPAEERGEPLPLWPVLNEHARWLARLNPDWKRHDPDLAPPALRLARKKREWTDAHAADPAGTAQTLQAAWPTLKADGRRAALDAVAPSLTPDDRPLLDLALADRVAEIRAGAAGLLARLPGPLADEVRAAWGRHVQVNRGKLRVTDGDIPAALGQPDRYETGTARLLGALGVDTAAGTLGVSPGELARLLNAGRHWALTSALAHSASRAGVDLNTWLDLAAQGLRVEVGGWPTARRRALLGEAVARVLGVKAAVLRLAGVRTGEAELLGVLTALLAAGTDLPAGQAGALLAHLLREVPRHADRPRPPHLDLLVQLGPFLDPDAPLPPLPGLPPVDERVIVTAEGRERLTAQREAFAATLNATHAALAHALDLRRRVRESLKETS